MGAPANLSEQVLALPSGAGAVASAGGTFAPNLQNGSGSYQIPIATLAGHAGLGPALSLSYGSHAGNGVAGLGWSLGLASIDRRTDKGLPALDDDLDTFVLQGDELLPVGGGGYRLRIESRFARIRHVKERGRDFWVVTERDGTRVFYGLTSAARVEDAYGRIATWHPSLKQDANGNEVSFTWVRDATTFDSRLEEVAWAGCHRVTFTYESRPDPIVSARAGFMVRREHRLAHIELQVARTSDAAWVTHRAYLLEYRTSTWTGRSLLSRVRIVGTGSDASTRELPPLTFGYTDPTPDYRRWVPVSGATGRSLAHPSCTLVHQAGSGLPDLLEATDTGVFLRANSGGGAFSPPRRVAAPAQLSLGVGGSFISDMDGDGWGDLVVNGGQRVYRGAPGGGFGELFARASQPSFDFTEPGVRVVDLDADGRPDVLRVGTNGWRVYRNLGGGAWSAPVSVARPPAIRLDDPRVHLADITGDGIPDLVYVEPSRIVVHPGLGFGRFGVPYAMTGAPQFGRDYRPESVRLVDLTGSGQADLLYVRNGTVEFARNLGGVAFAPLESVASIRQTSNGNVEPVDLLGTGASGLLFSDESVRGDAWRFLELFEDGVPDLLRSINNGIGATTTLSYGSSASHWLRDQAAGVPWATRMPFAQRVVDALTTTDDVTGNTLGVTFLYHHGAYDRDEREFRGFARVDQIDRESEPDDPSPVAAVEVRRFYHTGLEVDLKGEYCALARGAAPAPIVPSAPWAMRSLRGLLFREETYAQDGNPLSYLVTETQYRTFPIQRSPGTQRYSFAPLAIRQRRILLERGREARVTETTTSWDVERGKGYGLPTEVRERGTGRSGSFTTAWEQQQQEDLERYSVTTYVGVDDPDADWFGSYTPAYLVGFPSKIERYGVTGGGDVLLGRELRFYDGADYEGAGYPGSATSASVTRGRLSSRLELAFTDTLLSDTYDAGWGAEAALADRGNCLVDGSDHYRHAERFAYDARGMVAGARDPNGNTAVVTYDGTYGLFPVEVVDAASQPSTVERGEFPFQVAASVDANGNRIEFTWDASGLPKARAVMGKEVGGNWQGDPSSDPTEAYDYDLDSQPIRVTTSTRQVRLGAVIDVHRYLDGLGRTIQERHTAEPDPVTAATRFRVSGHQLFNSKGWVVRAYQPTFGTSSAYSPASSAVAFVATTYDPLGRVVRVEHPDGTFETRTIGPWTTSVADRNDNSGGLSGADPRYGGILTWIASHVDTPTVTYLDSLGRDIAVSEAMGGSAVHVTRSVLDLKDAVVEIYDARGSGTATWAFAYDYAGRRLSAAHATALGTRYALADAAGNPVWGRDEKGVEVQRTFDVLNRPLTEASDDGTGAKLRRAWRYQEYDDTDPDFTTWQSKNIFGRVEEERDADGIRFFEYDWRGLATKVSYRFWPQEDSIARAWTNTGSDLWTTGTAWDPEVDDTERDSVTAWLDLADLTDTTTIEVTTTYDAAGRPLVTSYPQGLAIRRAYDEAGTPASIEGNDGSGYATVADGFTYNARGLCTAWTHGNGVTTERTYDDATERLMALFTSLPGASREDFQDLEYVYDPVGNPAQITDNLTTSTYAAGQIVPNSRTFRYDPRYRLTRATGRKHNTASNWWDDPLVGSPNPADYAAYDFTYGYDAAGNLTRNDEFGATTLSYKATRTDLYNGDSAEATSTDPTLGNWRYDDNGNCVHSPQHATLGYTFDNQLNYCDKGGGTQVRYARHGDQRVVRMVQKTGVTALGIYLGPFEYHWRDGTTAYTKVVLHAEGATGRHAQIEVVLAGADPDSLAIFHVHGDHLLSGHVLTGASGGLLSQEEFFAYGRASDRRDARNRYRYIGVERDEDTGLCMTGPRAYMPGIGRFLQGDPIATQYATWNPFAYARCNPVRRLDRSGFGDTDAPAATPAATALPAPESSTGAVAPSGTPPPAAAASAPPPAEVPAKERIVLPPAGGTLVATPVKPRALVDASKVDLVAGSAKAGDAVGDGTRQAAGVLWLNANAEGANPYANWLPATAGNWGHAWIGVETPGETGTHKTETWGMYPAENGVEGRLAHPNDEYEQSSQTRRIGYALDSEQLSTVRALIEQASGDGYVVSGNCTGWAVQFPALLGLPVPEYTSGFVPNPTELWYSIDAIRQSSGSSSPVYVRP